SDSPAPQTRQPRGDGESAGSILASFGLSNDDLEVLSHYPDDQLTPDTLPFILRDIQLKKSGKQKSVSSTSSSSYSHNVTPTGSSQSHSAEVPSLLTVTQTAGKVIDYGHASRGTEESGTRETFKREQLSSERTDRDYRQVESKQRLPSETRSEDSSRRSPSSSSASRHGSSKKLPTPTMISDFAAVSPKVFPHTCSLCHIQCDQEKDWVDHINTVDHTAACRDLRNKYPDWKPNLPSGKYRREPFMHRPHGRPYSPPRHPRPHYHTGSPHALGHGSKHAATKPSTKTTKPALKPATKTTKVARRFLCFQAAKNLPEVTDLVSSFGKINNVILLPCSEEASVCMMKTEDAQALASASELCIREQPITALVAKEKYKAKTQQTSSDLGHRFPQQKWNVLVTGLPDSGWSDADVAELVQSVGAPSDIILAKHVGKALVSFPDLEVAEELVKVHSFKPAMFKDTEVKMTLVKKQIGLSTPDKPPEDTQAAAEPSEQDAESQPDHCEDPHLAEMEGKDDCVEEEEEDLGVSVSSPASDAKPDEDAGDAENTEVHEDAGESEVENVEETQAPSSYAGSVSPEMPMPELPKGVMTEKQSAQIIKLFSFLQEISVEATAAQQKESDEKEPEHVESPTAEAVSSLESGQDPDGGDAPPEDSHVHTDPTIVVKIVTMSCLEYLVPKTGFFCKVCSRFFTGAKAAEISHCKTLKHYENLQVWFIEEQNIYTTKEIM
uniref:Zinc finger protein 638-like n=1 Tax=Poecilia formosa TaxID=48698 RepID=A0A096M729_POEFO